VAVDTSGRVSQFFSRMLAMVRSALADLFDQTRPFGRLALVHCLQAAGTAFITVSLAGSLFFSISPDAAKSKILLYLLITIAPFAVVGPALSPLLDRGRQARRTSVAIANVGSALACLGMAKNLHDLLLFPEAFVVLVLGKLYLVARASLVPEMIATDEDLASANAKLAVLASLASLVVVPIAVGIFKIGAVWVLRTGAVIFVLGGIASLRLTRTTSEAAGPGLAVTEEQRARPTRLASGNSFYDQGPSEDSRLGRRADKERRRRAHGVPSSRGEVRAAAGALTIARATVGFVEFFLAFALRRQHAATWWFGLLLGASAVGSLVGSLIVPRLRRYFSEQQIIAMALGTLVAGALGAALVGGLLAQGLLTLVVGIAPTSAKPALDSIAQHHVAPALLGRTFGRIETRLQLAWVVAALVATVIPFALRIGDVAVAAVSFVALVSYAVAPRGPRRSSKVAPSSP
jgi:hypothetical protein